MDTDTDTVVDTDTDSDTTADTGDTAVDTFAPDTGNPLPTDTSDSGGGPGPGPGGGETGQGCGPLQVLDCEGICANSLLVGDGVCHDGVAFGAPNFDCEQFTFDEGDCEQDTDSLPCGDPLEIRDCQGICYSQTFIGDGTCDNGAINPWGSPDFSCQLFTYDGNDCIAPLP